MSMEKQPCTVVHDCYVRLYSIMVCMKLEFVGMVYIVLWIIKVTSSFTCIDKLTSLAYNKTNNISFARGGFYATKRIIEGKGG